MIKVALEHKLHKEDMSARFRWIITTFPSGQNFMTPNSRKQSSTAVTEVPGSAHPSLKYTSPGKRFSKVSLMLNWHKGSAGVWRSNPDLSCFYLHPLQSLLSSGEGHNRKPKIQHPHPTAGMSLVKTGSGQTNWSHGHQHC